MYLYCYARSSKAMTTGDNLLKHSEGEWIKNSESLLTASKDTMTRVDGAIVLFLPSEAAVKFMVERIYNSGLDLPVFRVAPDGSSAVVLRRAGYNCFEMFMKVCSILGARPMSKIEDREDYAPDIMDLVKRYDMTPNNPDLLKTISDEIKTGLQVTVYSDIPLELAEPVLDSLSYAPYVFRTSQRSEMISSFLNCSKDDNYSVFITCTSLPMAEISGKCLVLVPKIVTLGVEILGRVDPTYASDAVKDTIDRYSIEPSAISTVAVSSIMRDNPAIEMIAEELGAQVLSFDSRLVKNVHLPLNSNAYSMTKSGSDLCTAVACLASDNGKIIVRRAGDKNTALVSACLRVKSIELTK